MSYAKLLQPVSANACGPAALALGLQLARDLGAHLSAVIVRMDSRDVAPLAGEGMSGAMIESMIHEAEADQRERAQAAHAVFDALCARYAVQRCDLPSPGQASASLSEVVGQEEQVVTSLARLADLTILPHPCAEEDAAASDCLHSVLFDSGRPVLIAPRDIPVSIGRRCVMAWNGTVEASSALAAMLPWMRRADAVRIIHAEDYQRRGPSAGDVLPYLRLHGIEADTAVFAPVNRDVGAGMLRAAEEFGADLLGMGAYSHSRLRQMILGGVTRHVLGYAGLPVLMSR